MLVLFYAEPPILAWAM